MTRSLFVVTALLGMSTVARSQMEGAAFLHSGKAVSTTFATDYQSIGINPANLGWSGKYEGKKMVFGLLEVGTSLFSDALTKDELKDNFLGTADINFSFEEKQAAASAFNGKEFTANIDVRAVGFSITTPKAGGFAFHVADHLQWWSNFNQQTSNILFKGRNASYFDQLVLSTGDTVANDAGLTGEQRALGVRGLSSNALAISKIMEGSAITHQWVREYALAWGYLLGTSGSWNFYGGLSARYLQGLGMMEIRSEGGVLTAYSALSPGYDIDYGSAALANPSTVTGTGFSSVGSGFSGDVGFSAEFLGKAKFGLSYTNIGSITWDGNVYEAFDDKLYALDSDGFDSFNFFEEADQIASDVGILNWKGRQDKVVSTPSQLRTGASLKIKERTEVGIDVVIPTNDSPGNLESPLYAVGAEFALVKAVSLNSGVSMGGMYKTLVPFGLNFHVPTGSWEAGVATRDVVSLFAQEPGMLSYCFGFLRFRI